MKKMIKEEAFELFCETAEITDIIIRELKIKPIFMAAWRMSEINQHSIDVNRACEWLKKNVNNYLYNTGGFEEYIPQCGGAMFIDFRKAMEVMYENNR